MLHVVMKQTHLRMSATCKYLACFLKFNPKNVVYRTDFSLTLNIHLFTLFGSKKEKVAGG